MLRSVLWLVAAFSSGASTADESGGHPSKARQRLQMDAGWRFQLDDPAADVPVQGVEVKNWRWQMTDRAGVNAPGPIRPGTDISGADWKDIVVPTADVFENKAGLAWFRTTLPATPAIGPGEVLALHFQNVDDNATIYLNGRKIFYHEGYGDPFDVPLDSPAWKANEPNIIAVLVENVEGGGGITRPVTLWAPRIASLAGPTGEGFDDSGWRTVHLPHDYVVETAFAPKGDSGHPVSPAWYRRTFSIPPGWKGKSIWIDFDGIYRDSKIWFNGQFLGEHKSGYIGVRYDLGKLAHFGGTNTLAVHVDPRKPEGWWYEGGGIYRHVWITVADALHIVPWSTFVKTTVHAPGNLDQAVSAVLDIQTAVINDSGSPRSFVVEGQILGPDGATVATTASPQITCTAHDPLFLGLKANVANPKLWSLETPNMYQLVTTVRSAGEPVDSETTPFGIRTIRFDPNLGFFLNDKPIKIKGTCNHQDFAGIGIALPDSHFDWRIRKLQAVGSNAYRMSHNPVEPMLDACDRLGMLVFAETRHFGDTYEMKSTIDTPSNDLADLADMVRSERNHPSIILWSVGNEETAVERTPDGARIARAMKTRIDSLDGTRPVTAAIVEHFAGAPGISGVVDVEGMNYGPPQHYDRFHREHPLQPMIASETASSLSTRGIYTMNRFTRPKLKHVFIGDEALGYMNGYGLSTERGHAAGTSWAPVAERPFVAGAFIWTGFDYRGEAYPFAWPNISSQFGFMDTCGFPKDDYYYYLAWWGDKPAVHLAPHWNWPLDKGDIKVVCQGNTERLELFLNGRSLGSQPMPRYGHLEWQVRYEPGKLEVRGFNGAELAATDQVETTGPAAALRLTTDRAELLADAEDESPVEVAVLDSSGRVVPTADDEITFTVAGPGVVAGVGNGDPASHEPDKATQRRAFNGHGMAIIQTTNDPGAITVTATAQGLAPATITLSSKPSQIKQIGVPQR